MGNTMASWLFGGCQAANVPTYFDIRSDHTILQFIFDSLTRGRFL